ncbi:MAG: Flp pilus assembly complex ATPase component TadA [Dethiobacter sp.]|nr:Flp pilus assembly complex ATPase component TadA [Dethiobacter sp.]MCL4464049.1 Flp pilus assembly complex ATPase component TadA [Bacillota bacterium]MCL5993063.1 Flp pilus assembly complex ATPase component TadA [Bacillota bacterium]
MRENMQELLGKRLIQDGIITQEQLEEALRHRDLKKGEKGLLGRILVKLEYCTEEDVSRIVAERAGVQFLSLESYPLDAAAMLHVSPEAARRYRALPIAFAPDGKLLVAMQQPLDILALDDLRVLTGYNIQPVVVTDSELDAAIKNYGQSCLNIEHARDDRPTVEADDAATVTTEEGTERPAVQLANVILTQAVTQKASDVHIEAYEKILRVRFRIDGVLHDVMSPPRQLHGSLVSRFKIMAKMNIAERRIPLDGRMSVKIEGKTVDVRVASLPASFGERLTLRLLERTERTITLEELGVAPNILASYKKLVSLPYGFIPVTGPTGSGKSTTLYASLGAVDRTAKNVITVEDPVEYRMEGINQVQINPKAGLTFASGLRSILRSDPDIVMVGEIRDRETARIAIEAALTGHMVFTTLHTNDAAGAISRLTEMGVEPYLTASSVVGIMAQRLARLLCQQCKEYYLITREMAEAIPGFPLNPAEETVALQRPKSGGCMRCSGTGYSGRMGIYELLVVTEEIQRLALEQKSSSEIQRMAVAQGMQTMRQDGLMKAKQGLTSIEEVLRVIV